ncbi:hypothetical protein FACS189449_01540 [Alphaproteobacteria bacterium]|nr:hypothetical protein FACS189449_01540 [Alphaproteobacteria bacterium]
MLALIVPLIINRMRALNVKKIIIAITALVYTAVAFNPLEPNGYLIKQRIRHLRIGEKYPFNNNLHIPVLIYCNFEGFRLAEAIVFFEDIPKYQFVKSHDSFLRSLLKYNHVFVVMEYLKSVNLLVPSKYTATMRSPVDDACLYDSFVMYPENSDVFVASYELELRNEASEGQK